MIVYAIQGEFGGPIKIGQSDDPDRRLAQLQGAHFAELRVVDSFESPRDSESLIHLAAQEHRIRGEWFEDSEAVWEAWHTEKRMAAREASARRTERTISETIRDAIADLDAPSFRDEDAMVATFAECGREVYRILEQAVENELALQQFKDSREDVRA